MTYKYGEFSDEQIVWSKEKIRKSIFFLLLIVDPKTKNEYENINVDAVFTNLLFKLGGMNSLLGEPKEFVNVMSLLERALIEWKDPEFSFPVYRKLILDAGAEVNKFEGV